MGDLRLKYEAMALAPDEGLTMLVYPPAPGTPYEDAIRLLAAWQAAPAGVPADRPLTQKGTPMQIDPTTPTVALPDAQFAGDVWMDSIAQPHESDQHMVVVNVRFAPGARTAWHSHEHGQYLRVTQGVAPRPDV